MYESSVL